MSKKITYPNFRSHKWLDTGKRAVRYGIQIQMIPDGPWMHCHKSGKPVLCTTQEIVDRKIAKLRETWS